MPTKPLSAPTPVAMTSIRENELVSSRAITEGTTRIAATRVTPMTVSDARIDSDRTAISSASSRLVFTPDTAATSGSKVRNSSWR